MGVASKVTPFRGGRLGNAIIHTYKAFWFACIHGIPLKNVILHENEALTRRPLFSRLLPYFVSASEFDKTLYNVVKDCGTKDTRTARHELYDLDVGDNDNVALIHASLYPELPWEKALFCSMYDNPEYRAGLADEYRRQLCGNTVGYTIRRTDMLNLDHFTSPTELSIVTDMRKIIGRHYGMVTIFVTSDDIDYSKHLASKYPDIGRHMNIVDRDEDVSLYLLSLCDYVVNSGHVQCSSSWVNYKHGIFMSTFGQIAQLLNRSYKYSCLKLPAQFDVKLMFVPGCDYSAIPDIVKDSRDGCLYEYPHFIY